MDEDGDKWMNWKDGSEVFEELVIDVVGDRSQWKVDCRFVRCW